MTYWLLHRSVKAQNLFVVAASYVFYGWWNWHFLLLIALTSFCSYVSGIAISVSSQHGNRTLAKSACVANIIINLGILGVYKYYDFFASSLCDAFASIGVDIRIGSLGLVLPVGISFYTFQALSYTIDVYRDKLPATRDIVSFFAFLSFFPQLVAGPIERATNLLPQFQKSRRFDYPVAVDGMRQILLGFFKKIVVADNCAQACNMIFDNYHDYSGPALMWGAVLFTFQIYGDFSGYSDIAIGTARLFGIDLKRNFHYPYFSRNIAEFWKRWHISLNTWFVDYIYIPLGGSRCARWKVMRNTMVIFLVSGLWHGANWTFVCWGVYHAILFFPLLLSGSSKKFRGTVAEGRILPSCRELCQMLCTFVLVVIGWIIFRAENIADAYGYICRMFTAMDNIDFSSSAFPGKTYIVYIILLLLVEWLHRSREHGLQLNDGKVPVALRWTLYYAIVISLLMAGGQAATFIYFQF